MKLRMKCWAAMAFCALVMQSAVLWGQLAGSVPALSSRPGAAYTVYLNVAGFDYDGLWGSENSTPGITPALNDRLSTDTFNATEQTQIKAIWSRMAQSYIGFNVNVTTVDPAGTGLTDAQRKTFYDATPNMMHTVIGSELRPNPGGTPWVTDADGISGLAVISGVAPMGSGNHTNFMLSSNQAGATTMGVINGDYIGAISAHENAHAFGLYHQSDYTGVMRVNEYSLGDAAAGNGSYVPIIGQAFDRQRVTWRVGDSDAANGLASVNDVQQMMAVNPDLQFVEDGIGHTQLTATALALNGTSVDSSLAKGVIVPLSRSNPDPIGASNYTEDWFSFVSDGLNSITLTATNGTNFLDPNVADGVGTLRSKLSIHDVMGTELFVAMEDPTTLFSTYTGNLGVGNFFAKIASFGGHTQVSPTFNAASYYDMGGFFLSGSGFSAIPEPGSMFVITIGMGLVCLRRRKR